MLSSYEAQQDCTPETLQDICKENGINHLVLLKSSENDFVRVWESIFYYINSFFFIIIHNVFHGKLHALSLNHFNYFPGLISCFVIFIFCYFIFLTYTQ